MSGRSIWHRLSPVYLNDGVSDRVAEACLTCGMLISGEVYADKLGYCPLCYVQELNLELQKKAQLKREEVIELVKRKFHQVKDGSNSVQVQSVLFQPDQQGGQWSVYIPFPVTDGYSIDPAGVYVRVNDLTGAVTSYSDL